MDPAPSHSPIQLRVPPEELPTLVEGEGTVIFDRQMLQLTKKKRKTTHNNKKLMKYAGLGLVLSSKPGEDIATIHK